MVRTDVPARRNPTQSTTLRLSRVLTVLAAVALLTPALMAGVAPTSEAAALENPLPIGTQPEEEGEAAAGTFETVTGFSTKSGYRLVFIWEADTEVAAYVEWGFAADSLDRIARPLGDAVDTAGLAIIDVGRSDVDAHDAVFFRVRDTLTGEVSAVESFDLGNAWTSDASDGVYEIDAVLQLDSQALPENIPFDQGVQDLAKGIDIMAERVWDATDGYVRIDDVVVTDTVLNYPVNQPAGPGVCANGGSVDGVETTHTLADFLVQTSVPFDSHTWGAATPVIDAPCTAFYIGRLGQLIVPWGFSTDADLHLGAVMAHEFGHYAFGLPDLYPDNSDADCWAGVSGAPDSAAGQHDISMMHNRFGWDGNRWVGSELDRSPEATPCDHGTQPWSWDVLVDNYPAIPADGRLGNDLPDHSDSDHEAARGNPDGGALDVFILDHEPGASTLLHFIKSPTSTAGSGGSDAVPAVTVEAPASGAEVAPDALEVRGTVDREGEPANYAPAASLGASPDRGPAPLTVNFTPSATDEDGAIAHWSLDAGDGSGAYSGSGAPAAQVEHTYDAEGTYTATLTVTDDAGATATATRTITVGDAGGATRIGTDPAGDVETASCNDPIPCDRAWISAAEPGLDLRAAAVEEAGDSLRFTITVEDSAAFFNDPSGDPGAGDPSHVEAYALSVDFQTSPATSYSVEIERATGSPALQAWVGKNFGGLGLSSAAGTTPTVDNATNTFTVTVAKTQFPELAVVSTLQGLDAHTAFLQEGAEVRRAVTVDRGLANIENGDYTVGANAALHALGASTATPLPAPTSVPSDAEVVDGAGDVTAAGLPVPHMDIEAAWFENDAHYLYVGLKVNDIVVNATTAQVAYHVNFMPTWEGDFGTPAGWTFTGLRVEAILSAASLPVRTPTGEHRFLLQTLSTDGTLSNFGEVAELPLSSLDPATDIFWFVVPLSVIESPQEGDTLTDLGADSVPAVDGVVTFGSFYGDDATSSINYTVTGVAKPLTADAGGPYSGAPGDAIDVSATATGGTPPYACQWSGANATFADAGACDTTVTFAAAGAYAIDVNVTDAAGNHSVASAAVAVEVRERVEVYLDAEAEPRAVAHVDTDDANPAAEWLATVDLSDLVTDPGDHTLTAKWIGSDGATLDTHAVGITVTPAEVVITSPAEGGAVDLPALFEGTFSTTGNDPADGEVGASAAEAVTGPMASYLDNDFVKRALKSSEFRGLVAALRAEPGFLGAAPDPSGVVVAAFDGAAPADAPSALGDGTPVRYVEHAEAEPLMREALRPADAISLREFEAMSPLERDVWLSHGSEQGPNAPSTQQEAGPGGAIQMHTSSGTTICTASYLTEDPATGKYYLATAGHCLVRSEGDTAVDPSIRVDAVSLCVSNCVNNFFGLGNYVRLNADPSTGYHPVAYAKHEGVGYDFGLIEIPESVQEYLRPYLWFWGGPTGFERPLLGDALVHYGHGVGVGATLATQGRVGVNVDATKDLGILALGWVMGGDSGSAVGTAGLRPDALVVGDGASGAITHSVREVGLPIFWGTDFEKGLDFVEAALGFRPQLVNGTADIRPPTEDAVALAAEITAPADGATVDVNTATSLAIEGTGSFPPLTLPGTGSDTYYLHRSDCGGNDRLWMDEVNGGVDGGDGCGYLFAPAGEALELLFGEIFVFDFPADPRPASTLHLDPTRPVEATIYLSGDPSVINNLEARLLVNGEVVGSDQVTNALILDAPTPVNFSFATSNAVVPVGADLRFQFVVHGAAGNVYMHHGGDAASLVRLPHGVSTDSVEVSLDDPTFAAESLLPVERGATWEEWTAAWDLTGATLGAHTIYARAVQNGTPQEAAPAAVNVTLQSGGPVADFTVATSGLNATLTDASTHLDGAIVSRAWDLGDGATATGESVNHTYATAGNYLVTLTVTDDQGRTDTATQVAHVGRLPVEVRVLDASGAPALDWATVATPQNGDAGAWSLTWDALPIAQGEYTVEARMRLDGETVAASATGFVVPNVAPAVAVADDNPVTEEKAPLTLAVSAEDPNGDAIASMGADGLPAGAVFTDNGDGTGVLEWTPGYAQSGVHSVVFTATDADGATGATVASVTVLDVNAPPVLDAVPDQVVPVNQTLAFTVTATDIDGDAVAYEADGLPAGATFDGATGLFTWVTTLADEGAVHEVTFNATDGELKDSTVATIMVGDNTPPVVSFTAPRRVDAGTPFSLFAAGHDPDGDNGGLTYAWDLDYTGEFTADATGPTTTVTYDEVGDHTVAVRVTDGDGFHNTSVRQVFIDDYIDAGATLPGASGQRADGAYEFTGRMDPLEGVIYRMEVLDDAGGHAPAGEVSISVVYHSPFGDVSRSYGTFPVEEGFAVKELPPFAGDRYWPEGEYSVHAAVKAPSRAAGFQDDEFDAVSLRFVMG